MSTPTKSPSATGPRKVVVLFRATGDAPIMKQSKFKIGGTEKFAKVIDFLRKQLHRETLFVYINSAFSPTPDENIWDLFEDRWEVGSELRLLYGLGMIRTCCICCLAVAIKLSCSAELNVIGNGSLGQ